MVTPPMVTPTITKRRRCVYDLHGGISTAHHPPALKSRRHFLDHRELGVKYPPGLPDWRSASLRRFCGSGGEINRLAVFTQLWIFDPNYALSTRRPRPIAEASGRGQMS
jgi:hypothetical protein